MAPGASEAEVLASGPRERRGRVVSVRSAYRGYEYRCDILTKQGRVIGQAWVTESDHPALEVGQ